MFRADSAGGIALSGISETNQGVYGGSNSGTGVRGASASGVGVRGESGEQSGVYGSSGMTYGVRGESSYGFGVYGHSSSAYGVAGNSSSATVPAVLGQSVGNYTGVFGFSGTSLRAARAKTGVYGYAGQDTNSHGVLGASPAGQGVRGETTAGQGVEGVATSGTGVRAAATTGYALVTDGRVKLGKSAGVATIASAHSSITVTPGIDLTTTSAVIATLNGSAGGSTAVKRVAINTTTNAFTIYLTANSTVSVKVAWLLLG